MSGYSRFFAGSRVFAVEVRREFHVVRVGFLLLIRVLQVDVGYGRVHRGRVIKARFRGLPCFTFGARQEFYSRKGFRGVHLLFNGLRFFGFVGVPTKASSAMVHYVYRFLYYRVCCGFSHLSRRVVKGAK